MINSAYGMDTVLRVYNCIEFLLKFVGDIGESMNKIEKELTDSAVNFFLEKKKNLHFKKNMKRATNTNQSLSICTNWRILTSLEHQILILLEMIIC
jgi:hypothetical protein